MLSESEYSLREFALDEPSYSGGHSKKKLVIASVVALAVGIGAGVLIGYLSFDEDCPNEDQGPCLGSGVPHKIIEDATPGILEKILERMDAKRIRENLRWVIITDITM